MNTAREEIIHAVERLKIIVIIRGITGETLLRTVDAIARGGIGLAEITFDQSGKTDDRQIASDIRMLRNAFDSKVHIGAGTVMTVEQVRLAKDAGAEFIISPDCYEDVIRETVRLGMVSIPGAFTPTEAANAHRFGADFVKLFPNSEVKISYLKALATPLSHIRFLAVGGVNADNLTEYLAAGAKGVGVATGIVNKERIAAGDFEAVTRLAKSYTSQI